MAQKRISRFPLNEKFSGLSGHVPNYAQTMFKSNDVQLTMIATSPHFHLPTQDFEKEF